MGLLEELKHEAEAVKTRQESERTLARAREREIAERLQPKMREVYEYFRQLKEQLVVVQPDLQATYDIRGVGSLSGLRQCDYRFFTDDDPQNVRKFTFQFAYGREGKQEIRVESRGLATQFKEYLWANNLRFTSRDPGDGSLIFALELHIPVSFEFDTDFENAKINMRVRNLKHLGSTRHPLDIEFITPEFLEHAARVIVQKKSRFDEMVGRQMSESERTKIRNKLEAERRRVEALDGKASAPVRKKKKKKKKPSAMERFSRTFLGRK